MISIPGYQIKEREGGGRNPNGVVRHSGPAASPLYESGHSVVYRGIRQSDDQPVVLKLLMQDDGNPDAVAGFKSEYEMTRSLQGDGIIEVYGLESHQNQWVMVLEDFGGESLSKWMENHKELLLREFLKIAIRTTEILGRLHQKNIMHKDINPANFVYNSQTGQVKLIDFGIATALSRETSSGLPPTILAGTLAYMSPEQTGRMNRAMDYRTDLYSLGATFYELLTGQPPFQAEDAMELVHCHLAKLPTPPHQLNAAVRRSGGHREEIPVVLSEIVLKLMAKHAEDRYQSTFGLKADLEACLAQFNAGRPPERRTAASHAIETFRLGEHDISDRFQIPQKLYGRQQEIETLLKAFDQVSRNAGDAAFRPGGAGTPVVRHSDRKEMVMVTGYAGIGKSTLVHEIHKPIVEKQGYFISGKFDQFKRDVPFASLIDAFQGLIRQLLSGSESQVEAWKQKLLETLGVNGRVIIDIIPEVELIVGSQPPLTELSGIESQNRFNYVFQNFIRALSTPEHPLTVFLDDLQWADPASLQLIELFMSDSETHGLFLIGAYRDKETGGAPSDVPHVLLSTLETIRKTGVTLHSIQLSPLPLEIVNQLIADTFQCSLETAQELAKVCFEKTQGNPFFLAQFLHSLYIEGLVEFATDQQSWQWRMAPIHQANITDNVVELMAGKIQKLSQATQLVLQWAACLGSSFELNTLALFLEQIPAETDVMLWNALQEGLIVERSGFRRSDVSGPESSTFSDQNAKSKQFKFSHDRIQEAAYSLIEETERASIHLKIGRLLLEFTSEEKLADGLVGLPNHRHSGPEENPFDIVNHLNKAQHLIESDSERRRLAELNLAAGRKAKNTQAYSAAVFYLKTGISLRGAAGRGPAFRPSALRPEATELSVGRHSDGVASDHWQSEDQWSGNPATDYSFFFTLHVELAEAHYLNTDFEAADQLYSLLLEKAQSSQDKYAVYSIQLEQLMVERKLPEVIEVARHALKLLDIEVPCSEAEAAQFFKKEFVELPRYLAGRKIADLARETKKSGQQEKRQLILLSSLGLSALFTSQNQLHKWTTLKGAALCLQKGHNEIASYSYITYASTVLIDLLKDFKNALEYGKMAVVLSEKYSNLSYKGRTFFWYATNINPMNNPLSVSLTFLRKAIQFCTEGGDFVFAGYAIGWLPAFQIISGEELSKISQELEKYIPFLKRTNQAYFEGRVRPTVLQVLKNLAGTTIPGTFSDADGRNAEGSPAFRFDEQDFLQKNWPPYNFAQYHCAKIRSLTLFGHYEEALQHLDKVEMVAQILPETVFLGETYFYMSLTLTAVLQERSEAESRSGMLMAAPESRTTPNHTDGPLRRTDPTQYHQVLETYQTQMKTWAERVPSNFEHKYLLIEAERAKQAGQLTEAMGLYKQGIASAKKYDFLNMEALGNELYARFWLENDEVEFAKIYLLQAHRLYQQWGATGKVRQLEKDNPQLLRSQPSGTERAVSRSHSGTVDALDLDAIIKASQALSEEINLEKLLGRLMRIIIENAGAQKGLLLLKKEDTLLIEGSIDTEKTEGGRPPHCSNEVRIRQETPQEGQLPLSIVRFVMRTGESVHIDEESGWQDFSQDPYFTHTRPQAILCIPLKKKEQIAGVLYLENDITSGVFTEDRIQMLKILLAQATISLENSRLFTSLEEQKEEFRTLVENVNVGIYRVTGDARGTFLQVNPAAAQILGYASSEELMKIPVFQLYANLEERQDYFDKLKHQGEFKNEELQLIKKDGSLIWVSLSARVQYDENGEIQWTDGIIEDITERKKAAQLLNEYHQKLEKEVAERTEALHTSMQQLEEQHQQLKQTQAQLVQSEKMAGLGVLAAGVAHELNNPAAASQRGAEQLRKALFQLEQIQFKLGGLNFSEAQLKALETLHQLTHERAKQPSDLDPLTRSDHEFEIESWLEEQGVEGAWEFAPILIDIGYDTKELKELAENFTVGQFQTVITSLSNIYTTHNILEELGQGAGRISEIVKSLKSYAYLDQEPILSIDVHEGLNDTLVMLRSILKKGVNVRRDYAEDLPPIQAFGSELNQVWTNIIDNAVSAMGGQGEIVLRTYREDPWVIVEIKDTGPGIPEAIQSKIFDPFFTTKAPGEGTGLGLNISHNIIVQKHQGEITVSSKPGATCFEVKLPLILEKSITDG